MKLAIWAALPLVLSACAAPTPLPDAARLTAAVNPALVVATAPNPSLLAGFTPRPVIGPGDWRGVNDQRSPAAGGN